MGGSSIPDQAAKAAEARRAAADRAEFRDRLTRGAYIPERLPPGVGDEAAKGGFAAAEEVARRSHGAIPPSEDYEFANQLSEGARRYRRNAINNAARPIEERNLRAWAEETGKMLDDAAFEHNWIAQGQIRGEEHNVYFDSEDGLWKKRNNLSFHGNYLEYFHRLALNNWLFPDSRMHFEGFVDHANHLQPVVSQPDIQVVRGAKPEEVEAHMAKLGFKRIRESNDYVSEAEGVRVEDLHDENVGVDGSGNLAFMDAVPYMDSTSKMRRMRQAAQELESSPQNTSPGALPPL